MEPADHSDKLSKVQPAPDRHSLELAPPSTNNLEQNQNWGEVRITDPGADLKVTKVDVVPMQIEAAANQALKASRLVFNHQWGRRNQSRFASAHGTALCALSAHNLFG